MTELIKFDNQEALLTEKKTLLALILPFEATEINDGNVDAASNALKQVDKFVKKIKDERLVITRKIDALKKQYMEQEKEYTAQLADLQSSIKSKISDFLTAKERARIEAEKERARIEAENAMREEENKRIEEANKQLQLAASLFGVQAENQPQETQTPQLPPLEVLPPKVEKTIVSNVRQVKTAKFEIVDSSVIPRAFLTPDLAKIQQYANDAMKQGIELDALQLDGVKFYLEIRADLK